MRWAVRSRVRLAGDSLPIVIVYWLFSARSARCSSCAALAFIVACDWALADEKIVALLEGNAPRKVIVVPDRLVNVVA